MICVTINPSPHIIGTLTTPVRGVPYNVQLSVAGGLAPFSWSIDNDLPTGLTFGGGTIVGTTTTPGPYSFNVTVIDANLVSDTLAVNWFILPPPVVLTAAPPAATVNTAYTYTFTATGGFAPLVFSYTGTIPPGMALNASTGVLNGTSHTVGSYAFTITASDAYGNSDSKNVVVSVATAPAVISGTLVNGYINQSYTSTLSISAGVTPYKNPRVISGTSPAGLNLTISGSNLTLSGTPTLDGIYSFTVAIDDSNNITATKTVTMQVYAAIAISGSAPPGYTQSPYSWTPTVTGGWGGNTYAIASGAVPTGTSLNTSTGTISGTPSATGTFTFTVRVTDNHGNSAVSATQTVPVTVGIVVNGTMPAGEALVAFNFSPTATGGTGGPYTWSVTSGPLPSGLSINASTGKISGTPTVNSTDPVTVQAKDANNVIGSTTFTFNIVAAVRINKDAGSMKSAVIGQNYKLAVNVNAGLGPYTYTINGTRPLGTSFNTSTGLINGIVSGSNSPNFSITVTDSLGGQATIPSQTPTVYAAMSISDSGWNNTITANTFWYFNTQFTAAGGAGTYSYSYGGSIPSGTTLSAAGKLTGYCSKSGTYNFTIVATDKDGHTFSKSYSVNLTIY